MADKRGSKTTPSRAAAASSSDEFLDRRKAVLNDGGSAGASSWFESNANLAAESQVVNLYANRSVFVTGATGFIGKALVEKLIRSCANIGKIYVLIRPKKGKFAQDRLADLIDSEIFGSIRSQSAGQGERLLREKIVAIAGDISEPNYGICPDDMALLAREISIVFNSAATIRFSEPIENAWRSNIYSVKQLISFCNKLPNLEAIVHLSTAYSNCNRTFGEPVEEIFYEPPIRPDEIERALRELRAIQAKIRRKSKPLTATDCNEKNCINSNDNERTKLCEKCAEKNRDSERDGAEEEADRDAGLLGEQFAQFAMSKSGYPNTYTFTKAISEAQLVLETHAEANGDRYLATGRVPIAVVRPSIVGSAWQEPVCGFVDNMSGSTGAIVNFYNGALQMMPARKKHVADFVPVDMVVNFVICAGYFLITNKREQQSQDGPRAIEPQRGIYLFNYVSGHRNPMRWHVLTDSVQKIAQLYPSKNMVRLPDAHFFENDALLYEIYDFLAQRLPAKVLDFALINLFRRKPSSWRSSFGAQYERVRRMSDALAPFTQRQWRIRDQNVQALHAKLCAADKKLFPFDVSQIDWTDWMDNYVIGARLFVMKEAAADLEGARRQLSIRQNLQRVCMAGLAGLLLVCFFCLDNGTSLGLALLLPVSLMLLLRHLELPEFVRGRPK